MRAFRFLPNKDTFLAAGKLALVCAFIFAAPALASSIEKLEEVAAKAPNVRAFLNDPKLVNEYYEQAAAYYGGEEKFSRPAYDAILRQLHELDKKVPAVGARIWETTNLGKSFEIAMPIPISGVELRQESWDRFITEKMERLHKESASLTEMPVKERAAHIRRVFEAKQKEIEAFEKEMLPKTSKAERGRVTQEFYRSALRENLDLKAIAAFLAAEKIEQDPFTQRMFQTKSADGILLAWEQMRKPKGLTSKGAVVPDRLHRFLVDMALPELPVPKLEMVEGKPAETELFRVITKRARDGKLVPLGSAKPESIEFKAIPRRFHGIFKGVRLNECVGGSCHSLDNLTPERWATIALKDSRVYHVDKGGSHHGFVQLVPMQINGKTYASLEFGSPFLNQNGFVLDPRTKRPTEVAFTSAMLEHLKPDLPKEWAGIVVSSGSAINNAGVLGPFRKTGPFQTGTKLGAAENVTHIDPLAKEIISHSPRGRTFIDSYAGNMITDATSNGHVELRALNLSGNIMRDYEKLVRNSMKNPKKFMAALKNGTPEFRQTALKFVDLNAMSDSTLREVLRLATEQSISIPPGLLPTDESRLILLDPELSRYVFSRRGDTDYVNLGQGMAKWHPQISAEQKAQLLKELYADGNLQMAVNKLPLYREAILNSPEDFLKFLQSPLSPISEENLHKLMATYLQRVDPERPDPVAGWIVRNPSNRGSREFGGNITKQKWGPRWWADVLTGLGDNLEGERLFLAAQALANSNIPPQTAKDFLSRAEARMGSEKARPLYMRILSKSSVSDHVRNLAASKVLPMLELNDKSMTDLAKKNLHDYLLEFHDSPEKDAAFTKLLAKGQEGENLLTFILDQPNQEVGAHKYVARWVAETDHYDFTDIMAKNSFRLDGLEKTNPALFRRVAERLHASLLDDLKRGRKLDSNLTYLLNGLPADLQTSFLDELLQKVGAGTFAGPYDARLLRGMPFRPDQSKGYAAFLAKLPDISDKSYYEIEVEAQTALRTNLAHQPAMENHARAQLKAFGEGKATLVELREALVALRGRTTPPLPHDLSAAYLQHVDLLDPWIDAAVRFIKKNPNAEHPLGSAQKVKDTYISRTVRELDVKNWPATEKKIKFSDWLEPDAVTTKALGDPNLPRDLRATLLAYSADTNGYASRAKKKMAADLAEMLIAGQTDRYAPDLVNLPGMDRFIRANHERLLRHKSSPVIGRLKTCGDIYAELVRGWGPAGIAVGGAAAAAVAAVPVAMGAGVYYWIDKSRDRIYSCGRQDPNQTRLVKKSGRWFCEDGKSHSCTGLYDPQGYTDLRWSGHMIAGSTSKQPKGVRFYPYFTQERQGLDGNEYGHCHGDQDRLTCLTCQGSSPETPAFVKITRDGDAIFAVASDGTKKLILFKPNWGELHIAHRASDGKLVIEEEYLEYGVYKIRQTPLETRYPQWKKEIREIEQERK